MTIYTIGHSTRSTEEFIGLVRMAGVVVVVDVRSIARSRTNPQFNPEAFSGALHGGGLAYRHIATLGGLRHRRRDASPSPNGLWRVLSFRNYADYATTAPFQTGLTELRATAETACCAIMCAEAVWWRCHRRIIADYLLVAGIEVEHIMGSNKIEVARLTNGACPQPDGSILYPAQENEGTSQASGAWSSSVALR